MKIVEFQDVTQTYQMGGNEIVALQKASFSIEEGEFVVILGPSGSGKTTTLNLIGGMEKATSGTILVSGENIAAFSAKQLTAYRRNRVGYVFQFYNLIPTLTAFENVDMVARLSRHPLSADELLESVGLSQRRNAFPAQMSGGELQRVAIARSLCKNPDLLLCDEPTGALDSTTGRTVLKLLRDMAARHNKTVIMVTHNAMIAPAANRLIRIHDGRIDEVTVNAHPIDIEEVEW